MKRDFDLVYKHNISKYGTKCLSLYKTLHIESD